MTVFSQLERKIKRVGELGLNRTLQLAAMKTKRKLNILPNVPPTVYIELTDICNLKCVMCDRAGLKRKSGIMDVDLYRRVIDNAAEIHVPAVKLNRFGETLLHPHLTEMVRYAKGKGIPWVYFTSNATLLTEEKSRDLILSGLDSITFSFDGASKETYEKIRVNARYDQVRENIHSFIRMRNEMHREKPRVVINTILSKDTEGEIRQVFNLWAPVVDKINVLPVGRYGNVEDLSPVERVGNGRKKRPCHQIVDRLMVFWDGTVSVCCADINGDLSVGNVIDSRIEHLWKNEEFSKIRSKHKNLDFSGLPLCERCDATDAVQFKLMASQRKEVYHEAAKAGFKHVF